MKVKLNEQNELVIDIEDVLRNMTSDNQRKVVDALACQDNLIKDVADQIFTGWTEACSHSGICCTAHADNNTGLDYAMRMFAKHGNELAAKEITRLEDALRRAEKTIADLHAERWNRNI